VIQLPPNEEEAGAVDDQQRHYDCIGSQIHPRQTDTFYVPGILCLLVWIRAPLMPSASRLWAVDAGGYEWASQQAHLNDDQQDQQGTHILKQGL